ncbi:hypothetical protein Hanom_Chr14g01268511 [Helianthus anomalus]
MIPNCSPNQIYARSRITASRKVLAVFSAKTRTLASLVLAVGADI